MVGWVLLDHPVSLAYLPPERLDWPGQAFKDRPGGAAGCPAIADFARLFYVVRAPQALSLRARPGPSFAYEVIPREGEEVLEGRELQQSLRLMPESIWEHPDRPTLQWNLPYVFVADESVYVEQYPAFMSDLAARFPGLNYGGRFPIDVWPRQLNFSFQWLDLARDVVIRQGEPLFYVRFYPQDRDRAVRLVEAVRTPELERFLANVRDVTGMVDRSFSLFSRAAQMRPPRLVVPK